MSVSRTLDRERRLLAGVCTYSGCSDLALDGSAFCEPHDAHERGRARAKAARRRLRRAQADQCVDCGQPSPHVRCMSCREVQRAAVSARRRVPGGECRVPGDFRLDGLISAIRPGRERSLLVTLELPLALLLEITDTGKRVAPCGHRLCSRDDGRDFCVYQAIRAARRLKQLDGQAPDDRGRVEYALTVEQIAGLVGVTPRAIEKTLASALEKLKVGAPED